MIVIYKRQRPSPADVKAAIQQCEEWFKANPRRKVARVQMWGGLIRRIRRKHITEDCQP